MPEPKYQEPDAFHIELEYEDRALLAAANLEGFYEVECIDMGPFRDRVCVMGIYQRESDESYWSFQWSEHNENAGPEYDDYHMDNYIHRIEPMRSICNGYIMDWVRSRP